MRFLSFIQLLALGAPGALSTLSTVEECGVDTLSNCGAAGRFDLNITTLPEGVDPNNIRKCVDHPLPHTAAAMEKRSCVYSPDYGCSNSGYCWKRCNIPDGGDWCWTAANKGYGDWYRCTEDSQCGLWQACGTGSCAACGCSC
ncbi:hypothetical protein GGR58DRAFT_297554 [Xylaria digitata]|nr:hypothetical protein GGR58DRAFT_297554 [Xylaria digitata]